MEPHAVPQNVTSFEFRLIGDMTLKQFGYLAAGVGLAYLIFVLFAAKFPIVAWPIIVISALNGIAFAFLPISDRPLDYWVGAFLQAVFSPTKRRWVKNKKAFNENPIFNQRLNIYLNSLNSVQPILASQPIMPTPVTPAPAQAGTPAQSHQQALPPTSQPAVQPSQPTPQPMMQSTQPVNHNGGIPSKEELSQTVELAKKAQSLQTKILEEQRQLSEIKTKADLEQFNNVLSNLQKLVNEAQTIKQQLDTVTGQGAPSPEVQVSVVKPVRPKATQLTLTTFPNIINGVINDPTGNYLDNVVVVIYNKDGLPVRALKTNKLGQFTGSTPLPNGTYRIELEKENLIFDVLQIELDGKVLPPIYISAKPATVART